MRAPLCAFGLLISAVGLRSAEPPKPQTLLTGDVVDDKAFIAPDGRLLAMTDWSSGDIEIRDMSTGQVRRLLAKSGG